MSRKARRILLVVGALLASLLTPFAGLSAASAATAVTCTTTVTLTASASSAYYGASLPASLGLSSACSNGVTGTPPVGVVTVQRLLAGTAAWQGVVALDLAGTGSLATPTVSGTANYKVSYGGGTYNNGSTIYNFVPAESAAINVVTKRVVDISSKKARHGKPIRVTWKATPAARGIVYVKKKGKKKWKVAKRVTATSAGKKFKLRASIGTRVRFVIPGTPTIAVFDWKSKIKRTF